jgi:hypothetical protein
VEHTQIMSLDPKTIGERFYHDKAQRFDELTAILNAAEHKIDPSYPIYRITFSKEAFVRLRELIEHPAEASVSRAPPPLADRHAALIKRLREGIHFVAHPISDALGSVKIDHDLVASEKVMREAADLIEGLSESDNAEEIALAEMKYWQQFQPPEKDKIDKLSLGAMAAATNIYAAVSGFHRAPWHPKK